VAQWLDEREQRAWRGLLRTAAELDALVSRELQASSGLSKADYDVLVPLSEAGDGRLRPYALGAALSWEQSRLSHHVARMQRRGLVEREECRDDRRGAFVVLTSAGREALDRAAPAHVAVVREAVFDGLTADQVDALGDITATLLARLHATPLEDT
jgi:DNA-binding MarR family transcriptional regulator